MDIKIYKIFFWKQDGVHIPIPLKEGDNVLLPEFGGTKLELGDKKEYLLFREADILAKLE